MQTLYEYTKSYTLPQFCLWLSAILLVICDRLASLMVLECPGVSGARSTSTCDYQYCLSSIKTILILILLISNCSTMRAGF